MQRVIGCIEVAANATEQLSQIGQLDKNKVVTLCNQFLENIKVGKQLHAACLRGADLPRL